MKYGLRLPEHSGEFVRAKGGWRKYHKWLKVNGIARFGARGLRRNKVGRNELCPCESGTKFKKCCGKL